MRFVNYFLCSIMLLCIQPCYSDESNPIQSNVPTVNDHFGIDVFKFLEGKWFSKSKTETMYETWKKVGNNVIAKNEVVEGNSKSLNYKLNVNESKTAPILMLTTKTNTKIRGNITAYSINSIIIALDKNPEGLVQLSYRLVNPTQLTISRTYRTNHKPSIQMFDFERERL